MKPNLDPVLAQAVPASLIAASIMRDDGGEYPAFCLMAAYRAEKDATGALAMLTGAPAQSATAKQSPYPEYDKGFSDGWNRCEARQAAPGVPSDADCRAAWAKYAAKWHSWPDGSTPPMRDGQFEVDSHETEYQLFLAGVIYGLAEVLYGQA